MVRSRRLTRRRQRLNSAKTIMRRMDNLDHGVQFTPSADPPAWASAPWWPLTLVTRVTKTTAFTGKVIHSLLLLNTGLASYQNPSTKVTPQFNLRVQTVRAWHLLRLPLTLDIYTGLGATCRKLKQLNDIGSPLNYSKLAWRFGKSSFAKLDMECSSSEDTIFSISGTLSATDMAVVYIQLLVQLSGVPAASYQIGIGADQVADQMACTTL